MNHWFQLVCLAVLTATTLGQNPFITHFEWKSIDFVFPSNAERDAAIRENRYFFPNCTPIDVDVHYGPSGVPTVFVTFPRLAGGGIPITLGTVSQRPSSDGLLIEPFTNYSWHSTHGSGTNCDEMTSVFRVNVSFFLQEISSEKKLEKIW
jgi:hypothetical protein